MRKFFTPVTAAALLLLLALSIFGLCACQTDAPDQDMFETRAAEGGCCVTALADKDYKGVLTIPQTIGGRTVIGIDGLAGEGEKIPVGVTEVVLPPSVEYIGSGALYGMKGLRTVSYSGGNNVRRFEDRAFYGCENLESVHLGIDFSSMGEDVFAECVSLKEITADSENPLFRSDAGVLYSADGKELLFYPQGKTVNEYIAPYGVERVADRAFSGNVHLQSVQLSGAGQIGESAFAGCISLAEISADALASAGTGAFDGTPWLENRGGKDLMLGTVFVRYRKTAAETDIRLRGCTSIADRAFYGSDIERITLGPEVSAVGKEAFAQCASLSEIVVENTESLMSAGKDILSGMPAGAKIYVDAALLETYRGSPDWKAYGENIYALPAELSFITDGTVCETRQVEYGQPYGELPVPPPGKGVYFTGWYNERYGGERVTDSTLCAASGQVRLYAGWSPVFYSISYELNGGSNPGNINHYTVYSDVTISGSPRRYGYNFEGWEYGGKVQRQVYIPEGSTGDITLSAVWSPNRVTVSFAAGDLPDEAVAGIAPAEVEYGSEDFVLAVPQKRDGFIFGGWYRGDVQYTDAEGRAVRAWDTPWDIELTAAWELEESLTAVYDEERQSVFLVGGLKGNWPVLISGKTPDEYVPALQNAFLWSWQPMHRKLSGIKAYAKDGGLLGESDDFGEWLIDLLKEHGELKLVPVFEAEEHLLVLKYGGRSYTVRAASGSDISAELAEFVPVRDGYVFAGWKVTDSPLQPALEEKLLGSTMPDCSVGMEDGFITAGTAVWIPEAVKIGLHFNNGAPDISVDAVPGSDYQLPVPSARGAEFKGWQTEDGKWYTDKYGRSLRPLEETELTLYACWE